MQQGAPDGVTDGTRGAGSREIVQFDPEEIGLGRLQRATVIDRMLATNEGAQQLALIKATVAPGCTDAEVGHFLELCSLYGLDPFAKEAWCAKGKPRDGEPGKLLIMVGRDGLRKIVQRNGCEMESDVVREKDGFGYARKLDGNGHPYHEVFHQVEGFERGEILGSWARVYERKTGRERGWFVARLEEYKPKNASGYSPWSKQVSAMIQGAAERMAAREATPLSGLLIQGEDESAFAPATGLAGGEGDGSEPGWDGLSDGQVQEVEDLLAVADTLAPGVLDRASVQMTLNGRPDRVEAWIGDTRDMLAKRTES